MSEKLLVIGSNSFSGSHFVAQALLEGCEVVGVSRSEEPSQAFLPYRWGASPGPGAARRGGQPGAPGRGRFTFHRLDLNHDLPRILALVDELRPDALVNFAAQSMVAESWQHPEHWMATNVVATVALHEGLRRRPFLRRYVHVSTPEVYGTMQGLTAEHTRYDPSTPYAVSRAAADMSLMTYFRNYAFPVVFTRAANVYGPGQQLYRIIPRAILFFLTGRRLQLHGGGRSVRSFIHIRDVAHGTLAVARRGAPGEIFHLATGSNMAVRALVEQIAERMGVRFGEAVEVVGDRPGKDSAYLLDSSKALAQLGWAARTSLEAGLEETIAWVKANLDELLAQPLDYVHRP
jgi:dTDP-glucose 4,6-dehydratase